MGWGLANHFFCLCLQHGPATPFDFLTMVSQVCEKVVYLLLLSRGTGAQARLAVTAWRTQPQMASSALKSGL